uniref:Junctional sarcoplasmic reticulum protein 1 n=1 Tax=Saimiri boliviensis boliviensis TaxID=39432 RepID=A0A2K6UUX1_SAIBB
VSMTTRAWEELDGGLGSCQALEDHSALAKSQDRDPALNQCLVLASLVALLGSAFQLCRDAVAGEAAVHAPAPEPWVLPSSAPREPSSPLPKLEASAPPAVPPAPPAEAEARPKVPRSREAAEKDEGEPGEATGGAAGEDRAPLDDRGPKERPRREGKPRKEKPRKEERPKKERPRKEEKPRAAREPREALPRRWESREGSHRPWARHSSDAEPRKRQVWVSPRRPDQEERPRSSLKLRAGKGRD